MTTTSDRCTHFFKNTFLALVNDIFGDMLMRNGSDLSCIMMYSCYKKNAGVEQASTVIHDDRKAFKKYVMQGLTIRQRCRFRIDDHDETV